MLFSAMTLHVDAVSPSFGREYLQLGGIPLPRGLWKRKGTRGPEQRLARTETLQPVEGNLFKNQATLVR